MSMLSKMNDAVRRRKKKPPVRRVFGRVRNVAVADGMYSFEMVKDGVAPDGKPVPGGVRVRRKHSRTSRVVTFAQIASLGRVQPELFAEALRKDK